MPLGANSCWRGVWRSGVCSLFRSATGGNGKCNWHSNMKSTDLRFDRNLKQRGMLDSTLVVWINEFGRMLWSQNTTARDHNPKGFTSWLAAPGVRMVTSTAARTMGRLSSRQLAKLHRRYSSDHSPSARFGCQGDGSRNQRAAGMIGGSLCRSDSHDSELSRGWLNSELRLTLWQCPNSVGEGRIDCE